MRLNKIKVGGFRNIKQTTIKLHNITALVSLNSYGKTNLLNAINFGVDFISASDDSKKKMMSWKKGIPLTKTIDSKDYEIELDMQTTVNSIDYHVIYGYSFRWVKDDGSGSRIVSEWLKVKINDKKQKYNQFIKRDGKSSYYKSSEKGRCNSEIEIEPNELIINKLKAYDGLFYNGIIKGINNLSVHVERHLDSSLSYELDPFVRTDIDELAVVGYTNIPRVIFHLKKQHPDKYELLINSFMQLFPQITDITVEELITKQNAKIDLPKNLPIRLTNQFYTISVTDTYLNQPIDFESMSDGAKRILVLLVCILLADINEYSLIAIEEPENSIHPSLLQSYLRVISQFMGKCRIIITSHSPYIIQYLELSDIYIGSPSGDGTAGFYRIKKSMQKVMANEADKADMSIGSYIFELLSSSPDISDELTGILENDHD